MEKKVINSFDAQSALRKSQLKFAAGMSNFKPELVKVQQGNKQPSFFYYWKDKNYAYNPENGMCGCSSGVNYKPAQIGDENANVRVVTTPLGLAIEKK